MIATKTSQTRRQRRTLIVALVLVLIVDGATLFVRHGKAHPVSVNDAVKQYRADTKATPTPTPSHTKARPNESPITFGPVTTATPTPLPTVTTTVEPSTTPSSQQDGHQGGHQSSQPVNPSTAPSASASAPPSPTSSSTTHQVSLPAPGVYAYNTSGREKVGVPGGSRTFPRTSPITVESDGCGVAEIWEPNSEHTETKQLCLHNGNVRLAGFSTRVAFFGIGNTETYQCGADATVYSPSNKLGTSTTFSCSSGDSTAKQTITPVGYTHLMVGGASVRTLKVTVSTVLSGKNQGTSTQGLWLSTEHSVLVRNTGSIDATQQGVHYTEHYTLGLQSLTPAQ